MSPEADNIREMFNNISGQYDFLNHFLSFGIDRSWRRRVVREIRDRFRDMPTGSLRLLDVATGTGDLAIALASLKPAQVQGVDIATRMMEIGKAKVVARKLQEMVFFTEGAAENLPFADDTFDAVTVAFGVRNYEDLRKGLSEMRRVLRPGGLMLVLEFSHPESFPFKQLYTFYSTYMIPFVGRVVSKDRQAYTYLPESVAAFPSGAAFLRILDECSLKSVKQVTLTMGIASVYTGEK
jgi:demethylmenaquinone methyltransferase/2-methoxy-6-polyprenyl-1,4-benzoquinol methylase